MKKQSVVYRIYPHRTIERIDKKIKLLGPKYKYNVITFLNFRSIMTILVFIICTIWVHNGYLYGPIVATIFYIMSETILLDMPIKKRTRKLEKEAIFFFEVLSLALESGRNLTSALTMTTKNINSELSMEFSSSLDELKRGRSFAEALSHLKERIPSDHINNIIFNLVEASTFGNNIEVSLNNQLDFLHDKELLEIKSEIGKLPTKISIISVIFFIPIILLVILSPVIINFITK